MLMRAVLSVCRQAFSDFELIIIDDGSKQFSSNLLPRDPRIRILRNSSSFGVAQARNLGIQVARGTYISFLDDDDEYLSSFLASTYASLKDTPEQVGISWCGAMIIYHPRLDNRAPTTRISEFVANKHCPLDYFLSIGTGHGVTMKASCLKTVGPFNAALKVASDTDMFLRALGHGFTSLAVPGVHILRHYHRGPRLTGPTLYRERIRTWEKWLFVEHSEFLDQHPSVRSGFVAYLDFLKKRASRRHQALTKIKKQIKKALPGSVLDCITAVRRHIRCNGYFPSAIRPQAFNEKVLHRILFDCRNVLKQIADTALQKCFR